MSEPSLTGEGTEVRATERTDETAPPLAPAPPAGFWRRGMAFLLDCGVVLGARLCFRLAARLLWGASGEASAVLGASTVAFLPVFGFGYAVLCHWLWGQTLGKIVLAARVAALDGTSISLSQAMGRQLAFVLSVLLAGLGLLVAALRADKRALHDLLAGTRVERLPRGEPPGVPLPAPDAGAPAPGSDAAPLTEESANHFERT